MAVEDLRVLLVEDTAGDAHFIEEVLRDAADLLGRIDLGETHAEQARVEHATCLADGVARMKETDVDVVLLDLGLPESTGLDTLETMVAEAPHVPVVVLTGLRDEKLGIEAIQHGAQDFLVKDEVTSDLLVRSIHHAIERDRQTREQARRREQLEALNTLTRELMGAETTTELTEYVVDAADETLDLPVFGVVLYDETAASLELERATGAAAAIADTHALFDVDGGVGWAAFVENEVRRIQPREGDTAGGVRVTELAIFPLASHGVLVIGATAEGGFSVADFDFVETVAGTVEATLDRVDRERELHEREETLEAQNRTLTRLTRVNDIIRAIDRALVRASTRQEIESVVCEQLAAVGPYELAWIGEHNAIAEEVTPRVWAGNERGYLDGVSFRTDESPEARGPTGRAVVTREPQVVNEVVADRSFEPWRRDALNRGYHATIALPLVYEDTLYGVLNVYASQSGVFDDLERSVLTELADNIAYAINAAERKKALVSREVTRLEFEVADPGLEAVALTRELDCEYAVENIVPRSDGGVRSFFTTRGVTSEAVRQGTAGLPFDDLVLVSVHEEDDESVCLFEADLTDESLGATLLEHGARPHAIRAADGTATVTVELAADAAVREFVDMFTTRYPDSALRSQQTHEQPQRSATELRGSLTESLTDRQLEALQTAFFSGYFEAPRARNSTDVAESMGISQPTFNHHLRAALRKISEQLFEAESLDS